MPAKTISASHGVLKRGCSRRNTLRQLPVARHRVRDPRRADHAGVRGDEEDRRGEDADVDLRARRARTRAGRGSRPGRAPGRSCSPRAGRARGSSRTRPTASWYDRQRRERDERQREVDREDGDRDEADRRRGCSGAGRAPPRRGSRRSRSRCRRSSPPGSRARSSTTSAPTPSARSRVSVCGLKTRTKPSSDEQQLRREVDDREHDVQRRRLLDPDDVDRDEERARPRSRR